MRLLSKILFKIVKLVAMVAILGAFLRFGRPHIMKALGVPEAAQGVDLKKVHFSSEEGDLMATVMKSAFRLLSGQAKKEELAEELSDKLYGGKEDQDSMKELGIELVKKGGAPLHPESAGGGADSKQSPHTAQTSQTSKAGAKGATETADADGDSTPESPADKIRKAMLGKFWAKAAMNPELSLIPMVLIGMVVVQRVRRRRSPADDFMLPDLSATLPSAETENYTMKHAVHALSSEDFELLVARIYQRQGYRVEMPAGVSSGRGGDFTLLRKSERLLVQCKKLGSEQKVGVERVRELHDALVPAKATRGVYIASCGFSWDARNFAKAKGMTLINARSLDALLTVTRETPEEDLLAISEWGPKFMSKVKLTPPVCPACEAPMDEVNGSAGSVWVCSQRPGCRGRRNGRKHQKGAPPARTIEKQDAVAEEISPSEATNIVNGAKQTSPAAEAPASSSQRRTNDPDRTEGTPSKRPFTEGKSTPKAPPTTPAKSTVTPAKTAEAPAKSTAVPTKPAAPPTKPANTPPTRSAAPPAKSTAAPTKPAGPATQPANTPPTRSAVPPAKQTTPPARSTVPQSRPPVPPARSTAPPAKSASPPTRPTAPPTRSSAPPRNSAAVPPKANVTPPAGPSTRYSSAPSPRSR